MIALGTIAAAGALWYLMDDGMDYEGKHNLENLLILQGDLKLEFTCLIIREF